MGIETIFNFEEYDVKTFGGDVSIIIENNKTYDLKDALTQEIITPNDILSQVELDSKYGICKKDMYKDGGSLEYCYYGEVDNQYTILKFNSIDGNKDLIIGMVGPILNLYDKNK